MIAQLSPEQQIPTSAPGLSESAPAQQLPSEPSSKKSHLLMISILIVAVLVVAAFIYSYATTQRASSTQTTTPTTISTLPTTITFVVKPILHFSTLVNRSNVLFGIPNTSSFTLSYNFSESPPPHHNNYTTEGTLLFESRSYGMGFTEPIINYSAPTSPFNYVVHASDFKGNYPLSVIVYVWKYGTDSNATSRYLGLLHNSMGEGYNYSNHLNILNYSNHEGSINYSYPTIYFLENGTLIQVNGTNASKIIAANTSLSTYIAASLLPFKSGVNMTIPHLFSCVVYPVYGDLIQTQETVGYGQYVVSVYAINPIGQYNQSYVRNIALHYADLLQNDTFI